MSENRIRISGKFFRLGDLKWYVRGVSYGPFAPNAQGENLPDRKQLSRDFAHIRNLGGNCVRVYYSPPRWVLDEAMTHGLRVFVDVPWEKHRCFFEDWGAQERAVAAVRETGNSIGDHPAVFAISIGNEIPVDVVRFYGRKRVAGFLKKLVAEAKALSPECLVTYVNFPTTEFLYVDGCDFDCFNVYLNDNDRLGRYLDRLQHVAGNKPLILGEYGIDTLREGEDEQSRCLSGHLNCVAQHGLAGSFVFSYTDDWFTGGHQIEDWAFGITRRDRSEKPAAAAIRMIWQEDIPGSSAEYPRVSVVVCTYNGGKTLSECLESLMNLDYPDFEVIVVDDGSTDDTAEIAFKFPQVVYHHQENRGLSAARNVGAWLATGDIVAYTDDDCAADEHWLNYLVSAMSHQGVEAIGGPNIAPDSDGWIARCVAASPGNPSHVLLDDQFAEHVPGCNMAFRRSSLIGLGGFDPQFRAAGDDVDMCWRYLDAGLNIGYAPGAMVWHHRRTTVRAYARQQQGYGRSEAMVHFKHPGRFATFGRSSWDGIIYGDGSVGLPLLPDRIYHGRHGSGLFQVIYRHNEYGIWSVLMSPEWHMAAVFVLLLGLLYPPFIGVPLLMEIATVSMAVYSGWKAPLKAGAPWWCRPLISWLYCMQPVWRGWHRLTHLLRNRRLPEATESPPPMNPRPVSYRTRDLFWDCRKGLGRNDLLPRIVERAKASGWSGDFDNAWADWDIKLVGDRWHNITIRTATEELGWPRRFTRARCTATQTRLSQLLPALVLIWCVFSALTGSNLGLALGLMLLVAIVMRIVLSCRRCLEESAHLVGHASIYAGFDISSESESGEPKPSSPSEGVHRNESITTN